MINLNSIRFKITALFSAFLGAILVIYGGILYASLHYMLYDEFDSELVSEAAAIQDTLSHYRSAMENRPTVDHVLSKLLSRDDWGETRFELRELEKLWTEKVERFNVRDDFILIADNSTGKMIRSPNTPDEILPAMNRHFVASQGTAYFTNMRFGNRSLRIMVRPAVFGGQDGRYLLLIAASVKPIIQLLHARLLLMAATIPLVLLLTSSVGALLAARILKPVREITKAAERITHEDLSARVATGHPDEEMRFLVDSFNGMIERLEKSFGYISDFSSHVAHELKTPLSIIRGESEVALRKDRSPVEYKKVLNEVLAETGRMLKTIENLLLLTRLDYRADVSAHEPVDMADLLREAYEQARVLAEARQIALETDIPSIPVYVRADRAHMRRLYLNLIDNAIKYTQDGGEVRLALQQREDKVVFSVADNGKGIDPVDLPLIFNRFFRGTRNTPAGVSGSGLGLSIVRSIAQMHQADIQVQSTPATGSTFTVVFPRIPE